MEVFGEGNGVVVVVVCHGGCVRRKSFGFHEKKRVGGFQGFLYVKIWTMIYV